MVHRYVNWTNARRKDDICAKVIRVDNYQFRYYRIGWQRFAGEIVFKLRTCKKAPISIR